MLYLTAGYARGTLRNIGPGFFPTVLGWLLVGCGLAMMALNTRPAEGDEDSGRLRAWPTVAIPAAIAVFGLLIDRAHLLASVVGLVLVTWLALPTLRPREVAIMAVLLGCVAAALFVYGLDLPVSFLLPGR